MYILHDIISVKSVHCKNGVFNVDLVVGVYWIGNFNLLFALFNHFSSWLRWSTTKHDNWFAWTKFLTIYHLENAVRPFINNLFTLVLHGAITL